MRRSCTTNDLCIFCRFSILLSAANCPREETQGAEKQNGVRWGAQDQGL